MSTATRPRRRRPTPPAPPVYEQPWEEYAEGSNVQHFNDFSAEHCRQVIDDWAGQPLILEPWQFTCMGEALAFDANGLPVWRTVAFILPRKNGKTTMMAAYAIYACITMDGSPEVILAARTNKQADRLFRAAIMMIKQDPLLRSLFHIQEYKGEIHRRDGFGSILRFSAESGALDGYNPSLVILDELHAWETPRERTTFGALVSGFGARKAPQLFTITTAGDPATREDSLLGGILDGSLEKGEVNKKDGLEIARDFKARTLVYNYTAATKDPADTEAMKKANPASWITHEFLADAAAGSELTLSQKLRYYGGVWAADSMTFVTAEQWDAMEDKEALSGAFADGDDVALGADGSRVYDCTVASLAMMLPDGRIAVRAKVYSVRQEVPHHVLHEGGTINFKDFEGHLKHAFDTYRITSAAYDPRYLQRSAELLEEELGDEELIPVEPGSNLMRDAWATFYRLATEGRLAHDGDPVLRKHLLAAKATLDPDRGWLIKKRDQSKPIDALVASVIAVWRADVDSADTGGWMENW